MIKKIILTLFILSLLIVTGLGGALYFLIVVDPGDEIKLDNIRKILGRESTVFYSDGVTKLGVFFDTAHRQYVKFDEIPENFVNALVASEDDRFFEHFGFDIIGITRAMIKNIQAGRVVQGGSTLTQQTAKNLFKRSERSYEAKLKELLYALRLEYHYSKEQIFEFYANQFYVSGNGHGLGVAARYYFDKKPEDLTLIECSFIAGSVKRPNYYNPFRNKSETGAELAKNRAKGRLEYVLRQMRQLAMIDSFTYNGALESEIEFKNGKVGFALDHSMELVRDAVSSDAVSKALEEYDITNIATSGIKIVTTIKKGLQEQTLSSLRAELSRLDVRLRGYERSEVQSEYSSLTYTGDSTLEQGAFLFGKITSKEKSGKEIEIKVDLEKRLGEGVIDAAGVKKLITARTRYLKNRWSEAETKDEKLFLEQLEVGDRVWVSVATVATTDKPVKLVLEKYPQLQGAGLVVQDGQILALAGGTENRFFNRAIQARRTMGSAFKPLVYTAALQLGWNSGDLLKNTRELFVYHDKPYFPRPDHKSPHAWVSMSWAGVHSENVASVWLLSKLCEKMTPLQFQEVAEKMGMTPKVVDGDKEPYRSYQRRIRDKFGIKVNKEVLRETAFHLAVKNLESDFIFDSMVEDYTRIKELHYGRNFEKYQEALEGDLKKKKKPVKKHIVKEYEVRKKILSLSYLGFKRLRKELTEYRQQLSFETDRWDQLGQIKSRSTMTAPGYDEEKGSGALFYRPLSNTFYFLSPDNKRVGVQLVTKSQLNQYLNRFTAAEEARFWKTIMFDGDISVEVFDRVGDQVEKELEKLVTKLPYDFEVLRHVSDFRTSVGLAYLVEFGQKLGIKSSLEAVLSFPLGSNVVTLFEAARMYEGLVKGKITSFRGEVPGDWEGNVEQQFNEDYSIEEGNDSLAILSRIEAEDGEILFQPYPQVTTVVDEKTTMAVGSILENIVKFGTGRYADKHIKFGGNGGSRGKEIEDLNISVPVLGKTGTANNYTNASFLGFIPEVGSDGVSMTLDNGYAIGVYVGFDDNKQMRKGSSRISGAAGALPTWTMIANALQVEEGYAKRLDPVDLSFYGLGIFRNNFGQKNLAVDVNMGGVFLEPAVSVSPTERKKPSIVTFSEVTNKGRIISKRFYRPFWKINGQADQ